MINALVIHKTNEDLSRRKIYVRVEVGEEIIETRPSVETPKMLPHWENQILSFRVPSFCETGKVTVYKCSKDEEVDIGSFEVDMPNLLQSRVQRMFDEMFSTFTDGKQEVKGTLKFYTLKGSNNFIEPISPRKERRISHNPEQNYQVPERL